jgi:16S rRNA (cytosine1402-N4)-methyltransferase
MQFDEEERGFSFQKSGPLDMRMDPTSDLTAEDVVNTYSEQELGRIFRDLGEESLWRRGARAIVEARRKQPIKTTTQAAEVIEKAIPRRGKLHPATKIFQAIRIYINKELESIEGTLKKAIKVLAPNGKIGVISFHSLEDRIVKNVFREASKPLKNMAGKVVLESEPLLKVLTKKPIVPTLKETRTNRRSRSAKLRFAMKI